MIMPIKCKECLKNINKINNDLENTYYRIKEIVNQVDCGKLTNEQGIKKIMKAITKQTEKEYHNQPSLNNSSDEVAKGCEAKSEHHNQHPIVGSDLQSTFTSGSADALLGKGEK